MLSNRHLLILTIMIMRVTSTDILQNITAVFEEMFPQNQIRSLTSSGSFYQQLGFYLQTGLYTHSLAEQLTSYGCWCQIRNRDSDGLIQGHGAPVDILDAQCRSWQQCKKCVEIDSTAATCDWDTGIIYEIGFDPIRFRIDCKNELTECGKNLCECDENLAYELVNNMAFFDPGYVSNEEAQGFDFENACGKASLHGVHSNLPIEEDLPEEQSVIAPKSQCCGEYPYRFQYNNQGGRRNCCSSSTYDTSTHCCENGLIKSIGSC